jgi:hypothetical protein
MTETNHPPMPNAAKYNATKTGVRLSDAVHPDELAHMSEADKLRMRAIIEDGVERPCPGLPGAPFCGKEKENPGAYCTADRKKYQKERYRLRVASQNGGRPKGNPNNTFDLNKNATVCNMCGSFDTKALGTIRGIAHPPVCVGCFGIIDLLLDTYKSKQILSVLRFFMANPAVVDRMENVDAKHERIMKMLYDKWYKEEEDYLKECRILMPHKTHPSRPNPKDFSFKQEEYDRIAERLGYNELFERPVAVFELVNRHMPE